MAEISTLLFEITVIIFFAVIGYILAKRFNQPSSMIIIVIGIVIGPSVLGFVQYNDIIGLFARLGAIFILFMAGLHSDFREIFTKRTFLIGLVGGIVPFSAGVFTGMFLGFDLIVSFFIGAALTATCIGITSAVLKELGKIDTETAKLMLGAAVFDDVVGLIALSVVISIPSGISIVSISTTILLSLLFILAIYFLGNRIIPRAVDYFDRRYGIETPKLTFMLGIGLAFGLGALSEFIGLAAIVGAFFAGIALSKSLNVRFFNEGAEYLESIFSAVFFVSIGIVVSISALYSMWYIILIVTLVAILSKLVSCGIIAYKTGMSKKDSVIVGIGMSPRGEVAFIIALHGLAIGAITSEIYSIIIFMSFITTAFALIALKSLYESDGRKYPVQRKKGVDKLIVRNSKK